MLPWTLSDEVVVIIIDRFVHNIPADWIRANFFDCRSDVVQHVELKLFIVLVLINPVRISPVWLSPDKIMTSKCLPVILCKISDTEAVSSLIVGPTLGNGVHLASIPSCDEIEVLLF